MTMDHIFLGIQFPAPRNYERIRVENVNFNESVSFLKDKFREVTGNNKDEISLVYCGNILEENEPINRYVRIGSTIHVLRKAREDEPKTYKTFTELDVSRVCAMYRSLNSGNFHKISRPEVAKMIFDEHPEIKKDVVAMSVLKDPILLSNLQNPDTVRKLAQHHRVLIEASETIVKSLKSAKNLVEPSPPPAQAILDDLSDSSSSSSGSETNSPQASNSNINRRITQEYLRQSLATAHGRNSLASISQRNLSQGGSESNPISPSTSSGSVPTGHRFISPSMFMNAMNEVLSANRRASAATTGTAETAQEESTPAPAAEPEPEPTPAEEEPMEEDRSAQDARDVEMIMSFAPQLLEMEEMGLRNKAQNIQALMICNGNLEAAVNFVFAEMNNDMS